MRRILIGLLICLFWFGHLAGETSNLPTELQAKVNNYQEFIQTHQYAQAINLCKEALKEADDQAKPELELRLDEAMRQKKIFDKLIKGLKYGSKKKEIRLNQGTIVIRKANEEGIEGYLRDNKKERYKGKWADIPAQKIYGLFDIHKLKGEDKFNLAVWCFSHGLPVQAETVLAIFYKKQPREIALINPLLARIRDIPLPQGGFKLYNETTWITAEIAKQRAEILKKLGVYKGALDKPGADKERLSWAKAREKETEHLIVKTNLSADALNDICFILECAYFTWQDFFGFPEPKEKLKVSVTKNRVEFEKIYSDLVANPDLHRVGVFIPKAESTNKDYLLTYYYQKDKNSTWSTSVALFHEGTHYAIDLVRPPKHSAPVWLNEGLATYFESGKVDGKRLVTNLINQNRLLWTKDFINKNTYIKLKDFINLPNSKYQEDICYSAGWSLVYFLVNGKEGKYRQRFQGYIEAWKDKKIDVKDDGNDVWVQDKDRHIKVFEECMGVPIDQLEEEWKEYILQLK